MPALNPTRQNALILVALLFGQLLLMAGSARGDRDANMLETGLMRVSRPLVVVAGRAGEALRGAFTGARRLFGAHSENEQLRARVHELETELARTREAALENPRLRRLLGMRENLALREPQRARALAAEARAELEREGDVQGRALEIPEATRQALRELGYAF